MKLGAFSANRVTVRSRSVVRYFIVLGQFVVPKCDNSFKGRLILGERDQSLMQVSQDINDLLRQGDVLSRHEEWWWSHRPSPFTS